jgi:rod shape-determining protein MreC
MLQFLLKKKKFFFLSALLIVSLTLFARDVEKRKQYNFFDKLILGLLVPPLKITTLCINKASQIWEEYFYLVDLKKENSFLKDQIEKLEIENLLLREQSVENKRLRELLSFKKRFAYKILPAETIGRDPSSWFKTILIDKGKKDGVMRGSGVITPKGVVGKVINVSNNTSRVLLITDVNSSFDAVVKRSRERGVVEGYSENSCKLSYVLKTEDIKAGDVIVSSGLHNIYPKGVLIGAVSNIIKNKSGFFQFVEIRPSVNFSKLNEVLIVLK